MSETPANQFGISTDLPSVCECPPLCLHLFSAVCSFVFCQLDAALSLSLSLASPGKQQWPKKVWLQIRLGVTWILLPLRLSLNGQKLFLSLIDIVYNQKGNCTDWQVSDLTFSGFDLTIGAEVFACGEINWSLSNESLSVTSNFEAQLMACPPPPKKIIQTEGGLFIAAAIEWCTHNKTPTCIQVCTKYKYTARQHGYTEAHNLLCRRQNINQSDAIRLPPTRRCVCVSVFRTVCRPWADTELNVSLSIIAGCSRRSLEWFTMITDWLWWIQWTSPERKAPVHLYTVSLSSLFLLSLFFRVFVRLAWSPAICRSVSALLIKLCSSKFLRLRWKARLSVILPPLPPFLKHRSSSICLSDCLLTPNTVWSGQNRKRRNADIIRGEAERVKCLDLSRYVLSARLRFDLNRTDSDKGTWKKEKTTGAQRD